MQESLEGNKAREPLSSILSVGLGFAEGLGVVKIKIAGAERPGAGVPAEKHENTDQQRGHEQEGAMEDRIVLAVQRIGVRLILSESNIGARVALLAGGQDIGF